MWKSPAPHLSHVLEDEEEGDDEAEADGQEGGEVGYLGRGDQVLPQVHVGHPACLKGPGANLMNRNKQQSSALAVFSVRNVVFNTKPKLFSSENSLLLGKDY